jgi:NitT/TauT family transport system permease protein
MLRNVINPLITFLVLLGLWILSISWFNVPNYIFPAPLAVLKALKIGFWEGLYWPHLSSSLRATFYGYLVGCGSAFMTGVLVAGSKTFEKFVYPYVVGFQSMPKVAIAPLIIMWFGFGITSKIVIVALICYFPVFINTVVGIRSTDPNLIDLLRVFSASRSHIFFHAELPSAASQIFAGLQISVVFGLIGTIVAELGILGVAGSELVRFIHRKVVFWEAEATQTTTTV